MPALSMASVETASEKINLPEAHDVKKQKNDIGIITHKKKGTKKESKVIEEVGKKAENSRVYCLQII